MPHLSDGWIVLAKEKCSLTWMPFQSEKNLVVTLDNTLSFSANIKAVTRSCRFLLYNIEYDPTSNRKRGRF